MCSSFVQLVVINNKIHFEHQKEPNSPLVKAPVMEHEVAGSIRSETTDEKLHYFRFHIFFNPVGNDQRKTPPLLFSYFFQQKRYGIFGNETTLVFR